MSAFLGPIHVKMYDRVLYQDGLTQMLLNLAEAQGWADGIRERVDNEAPAASKEPLETLIDQSNIHGWLNEAVDKCERRLALVVSGILDGHADRLGELQGVMKDAGRQYRLPAQLDAERVFQMIHDILLDGMPCDFPFVVTESGTETVNWQVANCPHAPYWEAEKCEAETYYQLRDAWVEGVLEGSAIVHTRARGSHTLRKEW